MNKKRVEEYIPRARDAILKCDILNKKTNTIPKTFRGQVSSFGVFVLMSNFKAAIASFSDDGESDTKRSEIVQAMYYVVNGTSAKDIIDAKSIRNEILRMNSNALREVQEQYLDASIAIKLVLNSFVLEKNNG